MIYDPVEKPEHYNQGIEVIDVIEDYKLNYNLGNVIKYICRAKFKGKELEDLKKAKCISQLEIIKEVIGTVGQILGEVEND